MAEGKGYYAGTVDAVVHRGPCLLYTVILLVSVLGGDITIYDGLDATSGRKMAKVQGAASLSTTVDFGGLLT